MNILVFGVQGSGKSTHAEYIATKLGVPYIYTGDLFRNLEKDSSKQGKQIKRFMGRGVLIPDQITIPIFEEYLKEFDTSRGLVLDGFPRTKGQAEKLKIKLDLIIESEVISRPYIAAFKNYILKRTSVYATIFFFLSCKIKSV